MPKKMRELFLCVVIQLDTMTWSRAGVTESPKFDVRETIADLVHGLCPFADICDVNATSAEVRTHEWVEPGFISCCQGCSCHPDCKENDNCCFPDDHKSASEPQPTTKLTECLYTRLGQPEMIDGLVPAFKTIVGEPEGGCVDTTPIRISPKVVLHPTCDDIDVTPLGSYFPVFSWDTGAIYKNVLCARCHGIHLRNTESFSPNLICRESLSDSVADNSVTKFLNFLETGYIPPGCHIDFNFTDFSALKDNRCFRDKIDKCTSQSITLPPSFNPPNLNFDVIQSLCESGLYSPAIDLDTSVVYTNAFCSLCGNSKKYSIFLVCADVDKRTSYYNSFFFLLDAKRMLTVNKSPDPNKQNEICLKRTDKTPKEQKICRTIYCPTGMLRNEDGDCELIGNYLDKSNGVVMVKLTPTEKIDFGNESQEEFIESLVQGLLKNTTWPVKWNMDVIFYRINLTSCDEKAIAAIMLRWGNRNTRDVYDEIEASTRLPWRFEWKGNTYHLSQSLIDYRLAWESKPLQPSWQLSQNADLPTGKYFDCGPMIWKIVYRVTTSIGTRGEGVLVIFKKLFFCDQIQLRSSEFILGPKRAYLESNLTKGILHEFEFDIIEDKDGSSVRVCLSDTILADISTSKGTSVTRQIFTVLFSDIVFILVTYMSGP